MSDFTELEYKYKADDVSFDHFKTLMNTLPVKTYVEASSWDVYYKNSDQAGFIRFRNSPNKPELTRKLKTEVGNNFNRFEVDVPLDKSKVTYQAVDAFLDKLGYKENFRIFKNCFVYFLDNVNYVYYIVYNEHMKEKGRFVEVEVNKEKVNYLNSIDNQFGGGKSAEATLKNAAKELERIGLNPQNRMKKSLFELFERN